MKLEDRQKTSINKLVARAMNTDEVRRLKRHLAGEASNGPEMADLVINAIVDGVRQNLVAFASTVTVSR